MKRGGVQARNYVLHIPRVRPAGQALCGRRGVNFWGNSEESDLDIKSGGTACCQACRRAAFRPLAAVPVPDAAPKYQDTPQTAPFLWPEEHEAALMAVAERVWGECKMRVEEGREFTIRDLDLAAIVKGEKP